jgi:phage terminase large subunit-like protein
MDDEPGAQIYCAAGNMDQAGLLFRIVKSMIQADPWMSKNTRQFQYHVEYKNSFIKKISSKADSKHGFNTAAYVIDELHAAPNSDLYGVLKTSVGQRRNPVGWHITTAGFDKDSICYNRHDYTRKVLDGVYEDDNFWGVIYAAPEDADIFDPQTWEQANPLYQDSETLRRYIASAATEAQNDYLQENTFKRLHLNIWTGSDVKFVATERWEACNREDIRHREGLCYVGLALSSRTDITSLVLYNSKAKTVTPWFWVPEETAESLEQRYDIPFGKWRRDGHIKYVQGNSMESQPIKTELLKLQSEYNIKACAYDPQFALMMGDIAGEITFETRETRSTGYTLSPAVKELKTMIDGGDISHRS